MNIPLLLKNNFNNRKIKIPKLNFDKKIRLILLTVGTIIMLINCFYGITCVHYKVSCIEDMTHNYTQKINEFFLNHPIYNLIIKLIFSILIDLSIIYTLIIWSLYSTNIRLLSTGLSYMALNFLCRFIHIQIQPESSSFNENYYFSFFVNYQKTTYSFYPIDIGIIIICAFEWKRNKINSFFKFFIFLLISESIIHIIMQGNYFHEIFTSIITGHYLFIINEVVLRICFGEDYLNNNEKRINVLNMKNNESNNNKKDPLKIKAENVRIELIKMDDL